MGRIYWYNPVEKQVYSAEFSPTLKEGEYIVDYKHALTLIEDSKPIQNLIIVDNQVVRQFNLAILGPKEFDSFENLIIFCDKALSAKTNIRILAGGYHAGTDALARKYSKHKKCDLSVFAADWERHGNSAGYKSLDLILKYANAVVFTYDNKNTFISNAIQKCRNLKIPHKIHLYSTSPIVWPEAKNFLK